MNKDNAKLLQRWLDAKQAEANKLNEANEFYEDLRTKHENVLNWRDASHGDSGSNANHNADTRSLSQGSMSGKGSANGEGTTASTKVGL